MRSSVGDILPSRASPAGCADLRGVPSVPRARGLSHHMIQVPECRLHPGEDGIDEGFGEIEFAAVAEILDESPEQPVQTPSQSQRTCCSLVRSHEGPGPSPTPTSTTPTMR